MQAIPASPVPAPAHRGSLRDLLLFAPEIATGLGHLPEELGVRMVHGRFDRVHGFHWELSPMPHPPSVDKCANSDGAAVASGFR